MPGRPRKPTQLHILHGNPGKRRLPKGEPQPTLGVPSRPEWLSPEAKREWNRVAPELHAQRLLALIDRALLSAYCECWAQYVAAVKDIHENGSSFTTDKGYQAPRPAVGIARAMLEKMMQLSARFGFTPSDRAKMAVPEPQEENPVLKFIEIRKAAGDD